MHNPIHPFNELFAQLGLPCDENGIRHFLATRTPLAADVDLPDAVYWPPSTATFLRESLLEDSDWAVVVDQLSASLRPVGKLAACRTGETPCQRETTIPVKTLCRAHTA